MIDEQVLNEFREEIQKLGRTRRDQAEAIGVRPKTVERWYKYGPPPPFVRIAHLTGLVRVARKLPPPPPRVGHDQEAQP